MAHLILTTAAEEVREIPLDKERTLIGRHADNDIVLNDKSVSGQHAVVITLAEGSFLEDLNSTNGTLVNGRPVARHPLIEGDILSIGRSTLRYRQEPVPATETAAAADGAPARLMVTSGPAAGREMELVKPLTTLGKAGLQVAGIRRDGTSYVLTRLDGPPPRLNGEDVTDASAALKDGDVLELGGTSMRFVAG